MARMEIYYDHGIISLQRVIKELLFVELEYGLFIIAFSDDHVDLVPLLTRDCAFDLDPFSFCSFTAILDKIEF